MKLPELLAPVGGKKQLIAAVENGADAVYMGGKLFNARQNAENFDEIEFKEAIEYAHIRGVNVYITLNTLLSDTELKQALDFVGSIYEADADALIVQDLGFAALVKQQLPDFPLHLSTQGTIYNLEGVRMAEKLGFRRVVLARELSILEIKEIAQQTDMELEVFVHGALCVCYSGQCHLSNLIGGRSGNRGVCAQPCRLPYSILSQADLDQGTEREKGHLLSPKDLWGIEHLDKLMEAGVHSLKIEGRMKSPEYVAVVTDTYRRYLDQCQVNPQQKALTGEDRYRINQIYNRGGFTTGYLLGNPGRDLITRDRPKHTGTLVGTVVGRDEKRRWVDVLLTERLSIGDGVEVANKEMPGNLVTMMQKKGLKIQGAGKGEVVTIGYLTGTIRKGDQVYKLTDKELNESAQETFAGKSIRKVPVVGRLRVTSGEPMQFEVKDLEGRQVFVESEEIPEQAIHKPLLPETAKAQLSKTGATPFILENCTIEILGDVAVPAAELNQIRRKALEELSTLRANRYKERAYEKKPEGQYDKGERQNTEKPGRSEKPEKPFCSVYLYREQPYQTALKLKADRIYTPIFSLLRQESLHAIRALKEKGIQVYGALPPITKGEEDRILREMNSRIKSLELDGLLVGNWGHLEMARDWDLPVWGDYSFNLYNGKSLKTVQSLGLVGATLSHELMPQDVKAIENRGLELEATVYGRLPAMVSEHCPIGSELGASGDGLHCGLCDIGRYYLKDRKGAVYPILGDPVSCRSTILHFEKRNWSNHIKSLHESGVSSFRYYMEDESVEEMNRAIEKGIY